MQLLPYLKKTPLFSGIEEDSIRYFAENSRIKTYEKGAPLFDMGDPAEAFFLILEGWVKLYRMTREGEEAVINVFAPGESFAEAAVFGPMKRYPVNAQAVEKTKVLEIPRMLFVNKIKEDNDFALRMLGAISARQHLLIQQIEQVTVKNAPQRIGAFLLRLCPPDAVGEIQVDLPYDKSLIARRLNIQPETFSRALSKLQPYGVSIQGRHVTIEGAEKLLEYCDIEDREKPC